MQQQYLRRQPDERAVFVGRVATVVAVLVFAGWLAYFGVAWPWDLGGRHSGVAEFFGRFAGLVVLFVLIFSPLLIAASLDRRR